MSIATLVSIVIPTYGRNDALVKTIDCVRAQTHKNWEIIVVDDNPVDSEFRRNNETFFAQIANDEPIIYLQHAKNKGACAARNTGVERASGDVIAFYDDDDIWFKNKLESQLHFIAQHNLDFTFCWMNEHYNGYRKVIEFAGEPDLFTALLKKGDGICTSAIMVKKHVASHLPFDENLESFQDFDYLLRLAKVNKGKVQKDVLMDYQISPEGISRNPRKKVQGLQKIIAKFGHHYKTIKYSQGLAHLYQKQADFMMLMGNYFKALGLYAKALQIAPMCLKGWVKFVAGTFTGKFLLTQFISRKQALQWQKIQSETKHTAS